MRHAAYGPAGSDAHQLPMRDLTVLRIVGQIFSDCDLGNGVL